MQTIDLLQEEIQSLINIKITEIREFEEKIKELQEKIKSNNERISYLRGTNSYNWTKPLSSIPYNSNWTWDKKIDFVLKNNEPRKMGFKQIVDMLMELQPELSLQTTIKSVSSRLTIRSSGDNADLIKFKNEKNENEYRLKE